MVAPDDAALKAELVEDEGLKFYLYDDKTGQSIRAGVTVIGNPTIGIGRNLNVPLSAAAVDFLYHERVLDTITQLQQAFPWFAALPDGPARGLINMAFNEGVSRLRDANPKMIACFAAGDYPGAADEVLNGPWKTQVGQRAYRVAAMIRG